MSRITLSQAKKRLDLLISKSRVDLYKPIQIAEVLYHHRTAHEAINPADKETYRKDSKHWRDDVTRRLLGKVSTSSCRFQDDVWNVSAMPPAMLAVLAEENKRKKGIVEKYVYFKFKQRQGVVSSIFDFIHATTPEKFNLAEMLDFFVSEPGIRRSIDKAYEIVVYSLFETIVAELKAKISITIPRESENLLNEFSDLVQKLMGLTPGQLQWSGAAHLYRVGVTNAADRGLDMWANFGPAVQVKHLTLSEELAREIVDQVESEHIVVVCRDAEKSAIKAITQQIGWGKRVRGIVCQSELVAWFEKCLRGKFAAKLARPLLRRLGKQFVAEFPQHGGIDAFMCERGYDKLTSTDFWTF